MDSFTQFKEKVRPLTAEWQDEAYLREYLTAYENDVLRAEDQFKKLMEFRGKIRADDLQDYEPPQVLREYMAGGYTGHDHAGYAVKVEMLGRLDMRGIMRSVTLCDLYRYKLKDTELAVQAMRARNTQSQIGLTLIVDMEGVGTEWLWPPGVEMYIKLANIVEENYPGIVKHLLVVNTPSIFPMVWKLVRALLKEDIKSKVRVLGEDQAEELLSLIPAASLPAYLGGSLRDSSSDDPRCRHQLCEGGKVPQSLHLPAAAAPSGALQTVTVAAKGMFKLAFHADHTGAVLSYEFRTEDHDIGFKVVYMGEDEVREDVEALRRVQSHNVTEDGVISCDQVGTYEVVFDNSYSVMTSKMLHYRVLLHQTDDVTDCEVLAMQT